MAEQKEFLERLEAVISALAEQKATFNTSDIYMAAWENRENLPDAGWKYGAASPYSERIEDAISLLLMSRKLLVNPLNSCQLVTPRSLQVILARQAT